MRHNDIKAFLCNRAWRIYPAFIVVNSLVFLVARYQKFSWTKGMSAVELGLNYLGSLVFLPGLFDLPIMLPPSLDIRLRRTVLSYERGAVCMLRAKLALALFAFYDRKCWLVIPLP